MYERHDEREGNYIGKRECGCGIAGVMFSLKAICCDAKLVPDSHYAEVRGSRID